MQVAEHGNFALLDVLVERGASPTSPALLTCVAEQANTEALLRLLHRGAPLDAPGMLTALAATGQLGMLQRLAELGADLAGVPGLPEAAVSGGHVQVLDFLLGQGFEAQAVDWGCLLRPEPPGGKAPCVCCSTSPGLPPARRHAGQAQAAPWLCMASRQAASQPAPWCAIQLTPCPSPAGPPPPDQHGRYGRGPDLSYPTKAVLAVLRKMEACSSDAPSSSSGPSSPCGAAG